MHPEDPDMSNNAPDSSEKNGIQAPMGYSPAT